jgi:hypothetical protein
MREIEITFAWYTSADASVDFDQEDFHALEGATSEEAVEYAIEEIGYYGLPSVNGTTYVSDEILSGEDVMFGDLCVTFATLKNFSADELKKIAEGLDARRS